MSRWKKVLSALFTIFVLMLIPVGVVSAETDVSDTKEGASVIDADVTYTSDIGSTTDVDYYKIIAADYTCYYQFTYVTFEPSVMIDYEIVSDEGVKVDYSYVLAGASKTINVKLEQGRTYYLKVSQGYECTGNYSVKYSIKDDVADNKETAQEMSADTQVAESICISSDEDWYKIKAVDYTSCYEFTYVTDASAVCDLKYSIYAEDGTQLDSKTVYLGRKDTTKVKFDPGKTYYLKVSGYNYYSGDYKVSYTVNNDTADDKANAKTINANTKYSESIGAPKDQDWFKFYSSKEQKFTLTSVNEEVGYGLWVSLYDEDGEQLFYEYVGSGNKKVTSCVVDAGNYYLQVYNDSSSVGKYNFSVTTSDVETCLKEDYLGNWYYYVEDTKDTKKTGIVYDKNQGWWYVENGKVNFGFNDLYYDKQHGWWKITNGAVDFGYNGLYNSPTYGWWLVTGGTVDFGYNDLYYDTNCGWWKIAGGAVDFGYSGLYNSPSCGWWKVTGGTVDFGYNDLYYDTNCGWWKVTGGSVDFGYSGLYGSPTYGWWKVSGGTVDFGYNDLYGDVNYGWWKVTGGTVDFGYSGWYASPTCGNWYINGGAVVF